MDFFKTHYYIQCILTLSTEKSVLHYIMFGLWDHYMEHTNHSLVWEY